MFFDRLSYHEMRFGAARALGHPEILKIIKLRNPKQVLFTK